ncbi:hypothetical protein BDV97DRAFT_118834 [Delphinella strobiligena]|nr:hypothetical protein BDV97DRAFT_118834 [Delphinella strobiligena]
MRYEIEWTAVSRHGSSVSHVDVGSLTLRSTAYPSNMLRHRSSPTNFCPYRAHATNESVYMRQGAWQVISRIRHVLMQSAAWWRVYGMGSSQGGKKVAALSCSNEITDSARSSSLKAMANCCHLIVSLEISPAAALFTFLSRVVSLTCYGGVVLNRQGSFENRII